MIKTIEIKLKNTPGILNRITGILSKRQINIETLQAIKQNETQTNLTISMTIEEIELKKIIKQIEKQEDVIKIENVGEN